VTTEPVFADKYKELGYDNAILSNWHANPTVHVPTDFKTRDVCFIGAMTAEREDYILALEDAGIRVEYNESAPLSFEDMCLVISSSKISLNFSKNPHNNETQMKARLFEVPALKTLLVTEYHPGIEEYYTDKEIVTFKTSEEMVKKVKGLLQNPNIISKMTENGYQRFLKDHTSHKRLQEVLDVVLR
jgi:spore maturation protein CgeB